MRLTRDPQEQLWLIRQSQRDARFASMQTTQALGAAETNAKRDTIIAEQARLAERQATLAERRLQVERQILGEQRQVIKDRISAAAQELDMTRQRIKAEKDRLTSSAERFADLDPLQQSKAIAAMRKAQRLGAASLTRQERQLLGSIGTRRAGRFAQQSALAEARRAGFFQTFGEEERQNIQAGQQRERKLQFDIQFQRQLEIKVDVQEDALAQAAATQVSQLLERRFALLEDKMRVAIGREVERVVSMTTEQLNARSHLAGGR